MGRNRLVELQERSKYVKPSDIEANDDGTSGSIEMQPLQMIDKDMSASTQDFFRTFGENVVASIDKVQRNVEEVKGLHRRILSSVKPEEKESAERRLNDLVDENKRLSRKIQTTLKSEQDKLALRLQKQASPVKKWNAKAQEKANRRKVELRIRETQIDSQSRRFFDIWNDYNKSQAAFRDKSKEMLIRRCKIANSSFTDDQIEAMLEEGKQDVFSDCILTQTRAAQQQLTELQDRHSEFIKLERSIREMHEMFIEIATLVTQQGDVVNNVMQNVIRSQEDVEKARQNLDKAEKSQKSARKKKIICSAIGIVALLIILLVILIEFGAFSSSGSPAPEKEIVIVTVQVPAPSPPSTTPLITTTSPSATSTAATTTSTDGSIQVVDYDIVEQPIPDLP